MTLLGGLLAELSWRGPFWVCLATVPVFVAALWGLYEPRAHLSHSQAGEGETIPFAPRLLVMPSIATATLATIYYIAPIQISLMPDGLGMKSLQQIAVVSGAASIGYPIGAALFGRIGGRRPQNALASFALTLFASGLIGGA